MPGWSRIASEYRRVTSRFSRLYRSPSSPFDVPVGGDEPLLEAVFTDGQSVAQVCHEALSIVPRQIRRLASAANACLSFWVDAGEGTQFKCYESESPDRAQLIVRATAVLEALGVPIPRIHATMGRVVIAEWVPGVTLTRRVVARAWPRFCEYQSSIHQRVPDSTSDRSPVHVQWLLQRLERHASECERLGDVPSLCRDIRHLVPTTLSPRVIAPDFIAPNVVERSDGAWVIIDNEFLGIGVGWEFDVFNTVRLTFPDDVASQERYLSTYAARNEGLTLFEHRAFWEICLLVKAAGKQLTLGRKDEALQTVRQLKERVHGYARDCRN